MDREDGGILQLRVSAGKDDDGARTGWAPRVRASAKEPPPNWDGAPELPGLKV